MLLSYTCGPDNRLRERISYHRYQSQHVMPYLSYFTKKKRNSYQIVGFTNPQFNLGTA